MEEGLLFLWKRIKVRVPALDILSKK